MKVDKPSIRANKINIITPLYVRVTHWLNAICIFLMIFSGLKIYNAFPIFDFLMPKALTLGGWLGGALLWHFAIMWLLLVNGCVYLLLNIQKGRFYKQFFPLSWSLLCKDVLSFLKGQLHHTDLDDYNSIQKLAYLFAMADIVLLVMSGVCIWKPVQFEMLTALMGGFDNARIVHFACMSLIVAFIAIHLMMVALVPKTLLVMIRGRVS